MKKISQMIMLLLLFSNIFCGGTTSSSDSSSTGGSTTSTTGPEISVLLNATEIYTGGGPYSFGSLNVTGGTSVVNFTIKNSGNANLTISSIVATGANPSYFTIAGITTPATIAAGGSATFTITYDPAAAGSHSAYITIANNDSTDNESSFQFLVSGVGIADSPEINVQNATGSNLLSGSGIYVYTSTAVATPIIKTFTVQNLGTANLTISGISNSNTTDFTVGAYTTPIAASSSGTFDITFSPTTSGYKTATITITNNDSDEGSYTFTVGGSGIASTAPEINVKQGSTNLTSVSGVFDFGTQNYLAGTIVQTFTVQNVGTAALSITGLSSFDNVQFAVSALPASIAAGSSATFTVTFDPGGSGIRSTTIQIDNGDSDEGTYTFTVKGTGTAPAFSLTGDTAFGSVNLGSSSTTHTFYINNTGNSTMTVTGIAMNGTYSADYTVTTPAFPISIAAGGSSSFSVVFTPTLAGPRFTGTNIGVTWDTGTTNTALTSGTGVAVPVAVFTPNIDFGNVEINTTSTVAVTIQNTGGAALTVTGITGLAAPFTNTGGATTITAGSSYTFNVTFSPTTTTGSPFSDTINIATTELGTKTIALTGTATATPVAVYTPSVDFGNVHISTTSSAMAVVIQNTGNADLHITGINLTTGLRFAQTGVSPTTVTAGSSYTFYTTFSPIAAVAYSDTINIVTTELGTKTITLSGTGITAPVAVYTPNVDFGNVEINTTSTVAVTIQNTGDATLTVTAITGLAAPFTHTGGATTITAGSSYTFNVTFSPTTTTGSPFSDTINIATTELGTKTIALTGTATATPVAVYTPNVDFGNVEINTTSTVSVTIQNTGNAALTVTGITGLAAPFTNTGIATTITAGSSYTFNVTFSPTTTTGSPFSDTINIATTELGTKTIALTGTATATPVAVYTPSVDFGNVHISTTSSAMAVVIQNTGNADLHITGINLTTGLRFAQTGVSPTTVTAGSSYTFYTTFSPIAAVAYSDTINIVTTELGTKTITLSGTGITAPVAVYTPNVDFGNVEINTTSTVAVTIQNTGDATLTVTAITGLAAPFTHTGGATTITAGSSYTFNVTFSPTTTTGSPFSDTINIATTELGTKTIALTGTATATPVAVYTPNVDFGNVEINTTSTVSVTIQNTGNAALTVTAITGLAAPFTHTGGATTIAAGSSYTFNVTFSPTTTTGSPFSDTINIATTELGTKTIALTGTATATPVAVYTPNVDFGNVEINTTSTVSVTIQNTGNAALTVTAITGLAAPFTNTGGATTITAGSSYTFNVTFSPTTTTGSPFSDTINIATTELGTKTIALTGTATATPVAVYTPSVDFGNVHISTTSSAMAVVIQNTGNADLHITGINLTTGLRFAQTGVSPTTVTAGSSYTFYTTFSPIAAVAYSDTINIVTTELGTKTITLSGTGITAPVAVYTPNVDFGNVEINTTSTVAVTIQNTGDATLTVTAITGLAAPFTHTGGATTITAGSSYTFNVTFSPTTTTGSPFSDTINIATTELGTKTIALTGTATATPVAVYTPSVDFGNVEINTTSTVSVTIQNTGNAALTVTAITGLAAPFTNTGGATTIAAGSSYTFNVTFSPTTTTGSPFSDTINIATTELGTKTIALTGTATATPVAVYTPSVDFGNVHISTTSSAMAVVIQNTGNADLHITGINLTTGLRFAQTGVSPTTVTAGSSYTFYTTFSPIAAVAYSDTINIVTTELGTKTITLSGTGITAPVAVYTPNVDFGNVEINTTSTVAVTIQNTGDATLTVTAITGLAAPFTHTGGATTITAGSSYTFNVTFSPTTTTGSPFSDTINIATTELGTKTIALTGTATATPVAVYTPNVDFGNVEINTTSTVSVTIQNTGNAALTVTAITGLAAPFTHTGGATTITAGSSYTFDVTFSPTTTTGSPFSDTINIATTELGTKTIALTGTATATPVAVYTPNVDFGNVHISTTSSAMAVVIQNTGNADLHITGINLTTGLRFAQTGVSPTTVTAGSSYTFYTTFSPIAAVAYSDTINIVTTELGTKTITLSGTGITAPVAVYTPNVDFGNVEINTTSTVAVTIQNTGDATLTVTGITGLAAPFTNTGGATTITAGSSYTFNVTFSPTTTTGSPFSDTINIATTELGTKTIALTGTATATPVAVYTPSVDFGNVHISTTSSAMAVVIQNTGNADLHITGINLTTGLRFAQTGVSPTTVTAGSSYTFYTTFSPIAAVAYSDTINIVTTELGTKTITLSGTGITAPVAVYTPNVDFGNVEINTTSTVAVTIQNTGDATLTVTAITGLAAPFTHTGGATTITAGSSYTFNVTFSPTTTTGSPFSDTINIATTELGTKTIALTGTATATPVAVYTPNVDFGNVEINTTSTVSVTIQNTGNAALTVTAITGLAAPFTNTGGATTIAAGSSYTFNVTFSPTTTTGSPFSDTINIATTELGTKTIALTGTATATPVAVYTPSVDFGNVHISTTSSAMAVVIQNTGNADLHITGINLTTGLRFAQTGVSPTTVTAGSSYTFYTTFSPIAAVAYSDTINIVTTELGTKTITLSGTGITAPVAVYTPNVDFGNVHISTTSSAMAVVIQNTGDADLHITAINLTTGLRFAHTGVASTVTAGSSYTFYATFSPIAAVAYSDTINIVTTELGTKTIALSGTGITAPVAVYTPSVDFGNVNLSTTSTSMAIVIQNTGDADLHITGINLTTGLHFAHTGVASTVTAGSSYTFYATFSPIAAVAYSDTINIVTTELGTKTIALTGNGVSAPIAFISPTSINFGTVNVGSTSSAIPVTINNTGNAALTITGITGLVSPFAQTGSATSIAAGSSYTFNVTFSPTTTTGSPFSGTINIATSELGTKTIAVSGTAAKCVSIDQSGNVSDYTDIAVNGTNIYICYYSSGQLLFQKSTDSGATWLASPVVVDNATSTNVGEYCSITVNGTNIYISYYDAIGKNLMFQESTDSGATWLGSAIAVDSSANDVGQYSSITTVSSTNNIYISYYDATTKYLMFQKSTDSGSTWLGSATTVDSTADVGQYSSITSYLDQDATAGDEIYISYYDATNGNLRFAYSNDGTSFTTTNADASANDIGQYSSVSMIAGGGGGLDTIYISYYDATGGDLKFQSSTSGGTTWVGAVTVDSANNVGTYSSIAASGTTVYISYFDSTNGNLMFQKSTNSGSSWLGTPVIVTSASTVGVSSSIGINTTANIYISHIDSLLGYLKFASSTDSGTTW